MSQSWTRPSHLDEADSLCICLFGECVSRPTTFTYVRPFPDIFHSHSFVLWRLIDEVAILTSSTGWVWSSTTLPLQISCFCLPRSSSSRDSVVVLMSFCVCRSRGWHLRLYLLVSPRRIHWILYARSPINARCLRIMPDVVDSNPQSQQASGRKTTP